MRHRNSGRSLNRTSSHREAMFRNMACSMITSELIKTTLQKQKELRIFLEPLITLAKEDSVANRRLAFSRLRSQSCSWQAFVDLGKRFKERKGGYLSIVKCGFRAGDKAPLAIVELVEKTTVEVHNIKRCHFPPIVRQPEKVTGLVEYFFLQNFNGKRR